MTNYNLLFRNGALTSLIGSIIFRKHKLVNCKINGNYLNGKSNYLNFIRIGFLHLQSITVLDQPQLATKCRNIKKNILEIWKNKHFQTEEKVAVVFHMILYTFVAEAEDLLP